MTNNIQLITMFRSAANYQKLLDKATQHTLLEVDWESIIQICDLIRQDDVSPQRVVSDVRKKLLSPNMYTVLYALHVLDAIVKNCGPATHIEFTTRPLCDSLHDLARSTKYDPVRDKLLELIQSWAAIFLPDPKYSIFNELVTGLKADGFKLPQVTQTDILFLSRSKPMWRDSEVCYRCRTQFTLIIRKHHCRNCGHVFCGQCTSKTSSLPRIGIEKEVRVCDACFEAVNKPQSAASSTKISATKSANNDLPADYVNSSLARQSQVPPRKTEAELRAEEEDELNLALAISQSEAESRRSRQYVANAVIPLESPPRSVSPSPVAPELARYLNREYWESKLVETDGVGSLRQNSPSAPSNVSTPKPASESGISAENIQEDDFINTLKSQVEIFINRMKSNASRGRSIANDSSVQTLFMNVTAMHSHLLRRIQHNDDRRLYYEQLQDKSAQIRDARAALDDLRAEHAEQLRCAAEEAERQRQLQMAQKLEIMRKKKQEYLQYQRQLALQRLQQQEREMHIWQEHQKQHYLMNPASFGTSGTVLPQTQHSMTGTVATPHPQLPPQYVTPTFTGSTPYLPVNYQAPVAATPGSQPPPSSPLVIATTNGSSDPQTREQNTEHPAPTTGELIRFD